MVFEIYLCFKFSMCKRARAITHKMQRAITPKNNITFSQNFHQLIYSLLSISCPSLKLLAVIDFEISSFLCPNVQRAITKNTFSLNFHQVILLIILLKFEAPVIFFLYILMTKFHYDPFKRGI